MKCAETQVYDDGEKKEKINEMQFESRGFAPRSIATERNRKEERERGRKRFTRPITILRRERWTALSHKRSAQRNRSFPLYLITILSNHLISP